MRRSGISLNSDLIFMWWVGIERKIFNYLMFFTTDAEFKIVEEMDRIKNTFYSDYRRNVISSIELELNKALGHCVYNIRNLSKKERNSISCRFFAKQPFFHILPDNIKNYVLANSL